MEDVKNLEMEKTEMDQEVDNAEIEGILDALEEHEAQDEGQVKSEIVSVRNDEAMSQKTESMREEDAILSDVDPEMSEALNEQEMTGRGTKRTIEVYDDETKEKRRKEKEQSKGIKREIEKNEEKENEEHEERKQERK